jgi:hypothetical protein
MSDARSTYGYPEPGMGSGSTIATLTPECVITGPTCRYGRNPDGERHDFDFFDSPTTQVARLYCRSCGFKVGVL